jgi:hypothetical protein
MAKNYSVVEALEVLKGNDIEAKIDVIKRYPLFSVATPEQIVKALPEDITAKKVEGMLRGNVEVDKFGDEEVVNDTTEVEKKAEEAANEVLENKHKRTRKKKQVETVKEQLQDDDWGDSEETENDKLKSKKEVEEEDDWGDDSSNEDQNNKNDDSDDDEWDF